MLNNWIEGTSEDEFNSTKNNLQVGRNPRQEECHEKGDENRDEAANDDKEEYSREVNPLKDFKCLKLFFGRDFFRFCH